MGRSKQLLRLMDDFVEIRKKFPDKTIEQIAKDYGVSKGRVYAVLPEIAAKSGKTKEELLFRPRKKQDKVQKEVKFSVESVEEIADEMENFKKKCQGILAVLETIMEEN